MKSFNQQFPLAIILNLLIENKIYFINETDITKITSQYCLDLDAFVEKDPSCHGDLNLLISSYISHHSIAAYRLSNFLWKKGCRIEAMNVQEYSKIKTGIEIHPAATIGERFVIDHGIGTVIGETSIIGNNCYFLQNVILGASRIVGMAGKRHPTIGNNVEIGAFSRLFGPIIVGHHVKISPHSIITNDIPDNSIVIVKNVKQEIKTL
ncbi:serine O-acetyltransferase [Bartonella sp. HY329]|uniref:serine O-acetyltransferase n=1 Tax=unclassified Bartonella TaxID=2645622 RepID=UPI0021C5DCA2|nr:MULTISPECIES: serine O-acetyltransferase [unclassified Bartonella]UXM95703.1 serine O-acetyltransferase [Bartonella sp. HY329]UXN10028.1 serine O-acetyltransferase [Bartonella sp. HY328]